MALSFHTTQPKTALATGIVPVRIPHLPRLANIVFMFSLVNTEELVQRVGGWILTLVQQPHVSQGVGHQETVMIPWIELFAIFQMAKLVSVTPFHFQGNGLGMRLDDP